MTDNTETLGGNAKGILNSTVERIERLLEDKKGVMEDIKSIYAEAKGNGYDTKIIRKVIARRARDKAQLQEEEALLDLYESALDLV